MSKDSLHILLVEDEPSIAELLRFTLQGAGFAISIATDAAQARALIASALPQLVLLDWMLPDTSGLALLGEWRRQARTATLPVIMLTAKGMEEDKVKGLNEGADDYVNKPVQPRILLARLRVLLRRIQDSASASEIDALTFGALSISKSDRHIAWRGQVVALNGAEYKLFLLLAESAGQVLSRNDILVKMRGIEFDGLNRSIDNMVSKLRRKFDDANSEKIKTVRSEGYLFSPSAWN